MKTRLVFSAIALAIATSAMLPAQCPGLGNSTLTIIAVDPAGPLPGTDITIRITGTPNTHYCLVCDLGAGPTDLLPGIVPPLCVDFSPNMLEVLFFLPASGQIEFTVGIPPMLVDQVICCQGVTLDPTTPFGIGLSNSVCLDTAGACESGGVQSVGHITKFSGITNFPVTVTSSATGRAGGSGNASSDVSYDPNSPPAFPIIGSSSVIIENITRSGDCIYVTTLVTAGPDLTHNQAGRLPNECLFEVSAGSESNSTTVHTSCSQPLAAGLVFGDFTITTVNQP